MEKLHSHAKLVQDSAEPVGRKTNTKIEDAVEIKNEKVIDALLFKTEIHRRCTIIVEWHAAGLAAVTKRIGGNFSSPQGQEIKVGVSSFLIPHFFRYQDIVLYLGESLGIQIV